jgi:hypothetical protein
VYKEAAELCAYLCNEYGLTEKNIICHSEGYAQGIASNHGDVMHWFPKHGKSMDTFRADVKKLLGADVPTPSTPLPVTDKTPIMGKAVCTAAQLDAFAKKNNVSAPELGAIFIEEGNAEGVRGDEEFRHTCY